MEIIRTDMKKVFYSIISAVLLLGVASCQPEDLTPETSAAPITSVTATVMINGNAVGKISTVYGKTVEKQKTEERSFFDKLFRR